MANKKQTTKRRVAEARQNERQQEAANKKLRRRRLIVGFLAFALIAPLAAGLFAALDGDDAVVTTTTTTFPPQPWVSEELAGATLTGPTPCPADDGSAERTTAFDSAPPLCIDEGAAFELAVETPAGSFTLPVDSSLDIEAANVVVVLGRYKSYEKTPTVEVAEGLFAIGSFGDTGFTIPATTPTGPTADLYPIGSVVALAGLDNTISGTLTVVLDELGSSLLQASARHVTIGMIDDLTEIQAVADAGQADENLIDSITVTEIN